MSCDKPLVGYFAKEVNPTGKRSLVFKKEGSHTGIAMEVPCGKCMGCRLQRSYDWGVRCLHESKMHRENCFVTLTYDEEHLPEFGNLVPRHLDLFHKRLHNRLLDTRGVGIRYYACGEYGTKNKRPHYHSLIFGYDFNDKKLYSKSDFGDLFTSKELESLWYDFDGSPLGGAKVGSVSFESACYVARYCCKKVDGKKLDDGHYLVYNSDGVVFERIQEFPRMSRRPGIGTPYIEKYGNEVYTHDHIVVNGRVSPSIRYYDLKLDALKLDVLKKRRAKKSRGTKELHSRWLQERSSKRRMVREDLVRAKLKQKGRDL